MTKKKLLIFSYSLNTGGIERALINLLKNIDYNKYEVDLFLEEAKGIYKKNVPKKVNIKEYKVYKNKIKIISKIQNFYNKIKFKLKNYYKYDCSILYATYSYAGNFCVRTASKNRIMFVHSDYTNIYNEEDFRNFFTTRNIYEFNNLVFVSKESRDNFLKYYPSLSNKTHVINNLINNEEIEKKSTEKIKEKIKKTDINLIFVGRLEEESQKITTQLKLVKDLLSDVPNLKLFIVGDGIDRVAYESYIEDNKLKDNIFILGNKQNPYPYIKKCDYLLLISKYEGYPLVFTESLVLKTDVISTIKVTDDYFEIGKNYGFIVSKQYNKMKEEIKTILLNKESNKTKFNFEKINKDRIARLEKIFDINDK